MTCFRLSTGETLSKYCKRTGLNYNTVFSILDKRGCTPDEVIKITPRHYNSHILNDGRELVQACRESGIHYTTVLSRINSGKWTAQEAFDSLYERRMKRVKLFGRNAKRYASEG